MNLSVLLLQVQPANVDNQFRLIITNNQVYLTYVLIVHQFVVVCMLSLLHIPRDGSLGINNTSLKLIITMGNRKHYLNYPQRSPETVFPNSSMTVL